MAYRARPRYLDATHYRRRRREDAIRLLPCMAVLLFLLPLLWAPGANWSTAWVGLYLFAVWVGLIVVMAVLARKVMAHDEAATHDAARAKPKVDR